MERNDGSRDPLHIEVSDGDLIGELHVPARALGLVLLTAEGGLDDALLRRSRLAQLLVGRRLATLCLGLLSAEELSQPQKRIDVGLRCRRIHAAVQWVAAHPGLGKLPLGLYAERAGAAAALATAAQCPGDVTAIVMHGGRPDLVQSILPRVRASTLLLIDAEDSVVLDINRQAQRKLSDSRLQVIAIRSSSAEANEVQQHLGRIAGNWFLAHFQ